MASRGDFQRQLSTLFCAVGAAGYKFEDIISTEMLEHFQEMTALTKAREYIKEADAREAALQSEIGDINDKLKAKQAELDDQPEEYKALQVDFKQAQRSIDYYKDLADCAQERAERYQAKLATAEKQQYLVENDAQKMRQLQEELDYQQIVNSRLSKENSAMVAHYDTLRDADQKLLESKDAEITKLMEDNKMNAEIMECHDTLIENIEEVSRVAADAVNSQSVSLRGNDTFCAALCSQLQPLVQFYGHALSVVDLYRSIFHDLAIPHQRVNTSLPVVLDTMLDSASDALDTYTEMSKIMQLTDMVQDPAQEKIRMQIDDTVRTAGLMHSTLEKTKDDVSRFLTRLATEPGFGMANKGRFGRGSKLIPFSPNARADSGISLSRRSSSSSLASWADRFSFTKQSRLSDQSLSEHDFAL